MVMKAIWIAVITLVFALGWVTVAGYSEFSDYLDNDQFQIQKAQEIEEEVKDDREKPSPADRIKEYDIHVYKDRVVLDIEDVIWAKFLDTNSMDPFIDEDANALEIVPKSASDLQVGDVASYNSKFLDDPVIHRIVSIGEDDQGWYARFKGDNNPATDPEKVRFEQINRVVVAVLY